LSPPPPASAVHRQRSHVTIRKKVREAAKLHSLVPPWRTNHPVSILMIA